MNEINKILNLKEFKEYSIDTLRLLLNESVQTLFQVNDIFKALITKRLELWVGNFNFFKKILNDDEFYNEFEDYYKNSINLIHKILSTNDNYSFIINDNILDWNDNTNAEYENNFSQIKKEYGKILDKPLQLKDIQENDQLIINESNDKNKVDVEKEKLKRLSTKEKFKIIKKEDFFKDTIKKFIKLHIFIRKKEYKKRETERITMFFLHGYNEFFGLNMNLATLSNEFKTEFYNNVDNKGFSWAVRIWIGIASIPLLAICLSMVFLITIK